MSEELRILYVAMTRAKEKLILVSAIFPTKDGIETVLKKKISNGYYDTTSKTLSPYTIANSSSFLDIIIKALCHHKYANTIQYDWDPEIISTDMPILCEIVKPAEDEGAPVTEKLSTDIDNAKLAEIKERMEYEYPYEVLCNIPTKRSASAVDATGFNEKYFANAKPEFATGSKLTAAQKGTCLHRFMQFADFENAATDAKAELLALKEKGYFTDIEADSIDTEKIEKFFQSDMYARIKNSPNVMREKKFAVLIPAEKYKDDLPEELKDESVLNQGIADCVFEEDGKLIILDYKTDKADDENILIDRHKDQLLVYREALAQVTGKEVAACYLYAFSLDKEIKVI